MRSARDVERLIDEEYCVQLCDSDTCCAMVEGDPVAVVEIITAARFDVVAELRRMADRKRGSAHNAIWAREGAEDIRAAIALERAADQLETIIKAADADKEET